MANQVSNWHGGSGKIYTYEVHPLNITITPDVLGNYIFTRQVGNKWEAVYIGEGDLKTRVDAHLKEGNVIRKGATQIHLHRTPTKDQSFKEETDLLLVHTEAYEPRGCNVKKGG